MAENDAFLEGVHTPYVVRNWVTGAVVRFFFDKDTAIEYAQTRAEALNKNFYVTEHSSIIFTTHAAK